MGRIAKLYTPILRPTLWGLLVVAVAILVMQPSALRSMLFAQDGKRNQSDAANATAEKPISDQGKSDEDSPEKDYSAELPRIPPKSVEEELKSFELLDGFTVELVAAEPLVTDPIAFAFDANENLYVVEMRDYSEQETDCLGSIALLKDTNRDGRMDSRTTFVEGLSWPTAIWNWRDGVLVAEPPKITWYRDTDGDGKSDKSEVWFDGFQRSNVQGLVNSLRWGVDGLIHGATSSSGADLARPLAENANKVALRGRDFAIDPLTKTVKSETGGGQHGMSFNRWGDKFVTSNSDHLQQIIDLDSWLSSHSSHVAIPSMRRSIAEDGPQAEVFRSSPIEPWRIVRTRLRVSGVAPGIVEGGGRAAGYFTGATGTWIMDDTAGFGVPGFDCAIVCDVGSNLVHRKQLRSNGLFMTANRIDDKTELLRSSDTWFRPVQLGDGPDGALYIADMYREVIEHPKSLPPMIKKHLDLTSGRDRGRIWRVKSNTQGTETQKVAAECSDPELVARLSSSTHWQRRMASQLLVERNAIDQVSELKATVANSTSEARVLALYVLNRLGKLDQQTIANAIGSNEPHVQRHAITLCREAGSAKQLVSPLKQLAGRASEPRLQLELALTAVDLPTEDRIGLLQPLMSSNDALVRAIIVNAAGPQSTQLVASDKSATSDQRVWLQLMMPTWSKETDPAAVAEIAKALSTGVAKQPAAWLDALRTLPSASEANKLIGLISDDDQQALMKTIESEVLAAIENLNDAKEKPSAVAWLGLLPEDKRMEIANEALAASSPENVQLLTIESLVWANADAASKLLVSRFFNMTPALQRATLAGLMSHRSTLDVIAKSLEQKRILPSQIAPDLRQRLLDSNDATLKGRFAKLLKAASADRVAIIEKYTAKLEASDSAEKIASGKAIFAKVCAQCHRLGDTGQDVGPPLKQLGDKSPQQLLEIILDPNREVDPKYASYTVMLNDERVLAGIISEEAASQIVLAEAGGKRTTISRSEIDLLRSTGISLMPVGLEQQIAPEQMSELISYLKHSGK